MGKFYIPPADDDEEPLPDESPLVYKVGHKISNVLENLKRRPVFAYNFLSLEKGDFCFDNPKLAVKEYQKYFEQIKIISELTINQLLDSKGNKHHFHQIQLEKKPDLVKQIERALKYSGTLNLRDFPMVGQFALYTDSVQVGTAGNMGKAPRVVFFIGNNGVFHMLFMDLDHSIYPVKI